MVEAWWAAAAAIPAVVWAGQAARGMRKKEAATAAAAASEQGERGGREKREEAFVCERVCSSKRMLQKVSSFSKDPIPDTCATVCGVSLLDACADACARSVCANPHQVPNWNDICLRRCQSECLRLSRSSSHP